MKSAGLRKAFLGFTTVLLIAGMVVLYLVFFVQERRQARIERNFRILNTVSSNIQELARRLPLNAANAIKQQEDYLNIGMTRGYAASKGYYQQQVYNYQNRFAENELKEKIFSGSYFEHSLNEGQVNSEKVLGGLSPRGFLFSYKDHPHLIPYEDFLPPLLREDAFEHYLLVMPNGRVLYHTPGMNLLNFKPAELPSERPDSNVSNFGYHFLSAEIAGTDYRIFTDPLRVFDQQELLLVGMSSKENFNRATVYIPSFYLILFSLAFLLLLLSYPFLKLVFIAAHERLKVWDVSFALFALFAGAALSSLLVLDVIQYQKYSEEVIPDGLRAVSQSISTAFTEEVVTIVDQLHDFDKLYAEIKEVADTVPDIAVVRDTARPSFGDNEKLAPLLERFQGAKYGQFLNVAFINKDGIQVTKWTPNAVNTRKVNVNSRSYYQDVVKGDFWFTGQQAFVIESISSLNDRKFYTSISIKPELSELPVATLTTRLRSLHSPILSLGYGFAVIDPTGKVLYHSSEQRKLQENLLEEVSSDKKLRSYLISRSEGNFASNYHGEEYLMRVSPLKDWPLYLITYYDKSYLNSTNAEIMSFSLISLGVYLLPSLAVILFVISFRSRSSKLRFRSYRLSWLIPHRAFTHRYFMVALLQLLLLLFYTLFFYWGYGQNDQANLSLLCMVYSIPVFSVGGAYLLLQYGFRQHKHRWYFLAVFALTTLAIFGLAYLLKASLWWLSVFCAIAILMIVFLSWWKNQRLRLSFHKQYYRQWYRVMVVSGLLCLSLPVVFSSFKIAHDTEFLLYKRLVQLDLAEQLDKSALAAMTLEDHTMGKEALPLSELPNLHLSPLLEGTLKIEPMAEMSRQEQEATQQNHELSLFIKLYSALRPLYNEPAIKSIYLNEASGRKGRWSWESESPLGLNFNFRSSFLPDNGPPLMAYFQLSTTLPDYRVPLWDSHYAVIFILIALLLLLLLYRMIRYLYRQIFLPQSFDLHWMVKIEDILLESDGRLNERISSQKIFFMGLPKSGKSRYLLRLVKQHGLALQKMDFARIGQPEEFELQPSTRLVLLDHFEYGLHLQEVDHRKLEILEDLMSRRKLGIIIISSVNPLDFYREQQLSKEPVEKQESNQVVLSFDEQRWLRLLGNFQKTFYLGASKSGLTMYSGIPDLEDQDQRQLLERECDALPFLNKLKPGLLRNLAKSHELGPLTNDELILKIQSIAGFYYNALWQSCSYPEKYFLYDLAQDGLVNIRNTDVVHSLISKGLITHEGLLKVANLSFRNYILTNIRAEEILHLEQNVGSASTWKQIRTPLIILLLLLAGFLFYTQRDLLNNVVAMLTAIGGAVLTILRFSSNLGISQKPPGGQTN